MSEKLNQPKDKGRAHGHAPAPQDGKRWWLDDPRNIDKIWYGLIAVCVALFFADFLYEKHPYFSIEHLPNFYGFYGFVACIILVLAAAQLRKVLMRDEDYYERDEAANEERNSGGAAQDKPDEGEDA